MSGEFALAVGPNVLVDGDFSAAQNPGSYSTYAKGSHAIAGWTVTRATVDLIGTYWTAPGGRRSVDLDGTPGFGAIAQTFRTLPGAKYVTSFLLSANGECPPPVKRLRVSVGPADAWPAKRVTFVATRRLTTLEFASMDAVGGDCGPVVAAISVRRV